MEELVDLLNKIIIIIYVIIFTVDVLWITFYFYNHREFNLKTSKFVSMFNIISSCLPIFILLNELLFVFFEWVSAIDNYNNDTPFTDNFIYVCVPSLIFSIIFIVIGALLLKRTIKLEHTKYKIIISDNFAKPNGANTNIPINNTTSFDTINFTNNTNGVSRNTSYPNINNSFANNNNCTSGNNNLFVNNSIAFGDNSNITHSDNITTTSGNNN